MSRDRIMNIGVAATRTPEIGEDRGTNSLCQFEDGDTQELAEQIKLLDAKTVLEFGPGLSTQALSKLGMKVTTCEDIDQWFDVAKEQFKDDPNVRVLKYDNTFPVVVHGLDEKERFDLAFVDGPKGYNPARVRHKGFEDCSRINTCLFALQRCKAVILHDAARPLERGTLGRLNALGFVYEWLPHSRIGMVRITHGDTIRSDLPRTEEPGGVAPRAKPKRGRIPVDVGPDRLDDNGTRKKGCGVRRGRRQSGGSLPSTPSSHPGVESGT